MPNRTTNPRIEWIRHTSQAIQAFPMGDKHERTFPVYLPPGYQSKPTTPYPTVYFLAGYPSKGSAYLADDSAFGKALPTLFDEAIATGQLPAFIGVFPDCTSRMGHSQYINSPALGNYMDYLCDELTQAVDDRYPTARGAASRVLTGHSSGGYGALVTAMLRPDAFSYISSSAADGFFEVSLLPTMSRALVEIQRAGGVEAFLDGVLSKVSPKQISGAQFQAMLTLAMAPCYAPNPTQGPLFGDLFFDLETGAIDPQVWSRYLDWDPVRMVEKHGPALKQIRYIQLEAGAQDEHALQWAHRQFAAKLRAQGIDCELREYPGGHSGQHWRYIERLERVFAQMDKASAR